MAKIQISKVAAGLVPAGAVVLLDACTFTRALAQLLTVEMT